VPLEAVHLLINGRVLDGGADDAGLLPLDSAKPVTVQQGKEESSV
jgi:hypothetical protein